jgi:hypothetical protein
VCWTVIQQWMLEGPISIDLSHYQYNFQFHLRTIQVIRTYSRECRKVLSREWGLRLWLQFPIQHDINLLIVKAH